MGNIYDELKSDELIKGLYQIMDEYQVLKHQVRRIRALINKIDNSGLHNTADLLRDALAGEI